MNEPLEVSFTPRATRHVAEAKNWWRVNRVAAPRALDEELTQALDLIASTPHVGSVARNVNLAGVRRVFLSRVKYFLYYRVQRDPAARIEIVAFWHARRGYGPRL